MNIAPLTAFTAALNNSACAPWPPMSLLGMLVVGMFVAAALAAIFGHSPAALTVSTADLLAFLLAAVLEHGSSAAAMFRWIRTHRRKSG
jgi:hypothetical protein